MESYVEITKNHAGIIKAMKDALPRLAQLHKEYIKHHYEVYDGMSMFSIPSTDGDSAKAKEIAAMMMFKEKVKLSPSDAKFLTDQIKANKEYSPH